MRALPLLLLASCGQPDFSGYVNEKDSDTGETGGRDTSPHDTTDTDGDLDDDGYTPEEGDCDDDDVHVSPGRPEDDADGKDNDCDGRVDENWSGVSAIYVPADGSSSTIFTFDTLGEKQDEVDVDGAVALFLDNDPVTGSWFVNDLFADVGLVDGTGTYTLLGDFSDTEAYPFGVYGVATGKGGELYAVTGDHLWSVGRDGALTELGAWVGDPYDEAYEFFGYSVAYDPKTGQVGVFDGYGDGFGLWDPTAGFQVVRKGDLANGLVYLYGGAHMDNDTWYAPGVDYGDGSFGIYGWNGDGWDRVTTWTDPDWNLFMVATDGDHGEFYVTAYGGWFPSIWRLKASADFADDFYVEEADQYAYFYGIVSNY